MWAQGKRAKRSEHGQQKWTLHLSGTAVAETRAFCSLARYHIKFPIMRPIV